MLLLQAPQHNVRGESRNLSQMLSQKLKTTHSGNPIRRWYEDFRYFLMDNWQRCWVIVLWTAVMVALFTWKYIQYKDRAVYKVIGPCVCIAKGAAETLKLNMALILLPVCRNTITWLRNKTKLGVVVPFDDNLNFHKVSPIINKLFMYIFFVMTKIYIVVGDWGGDFDWSWVACDFSFSV